MDEYDGGRQSLESIAAGVASRLEASPQRVMLEVSSDGREYSLYYYIGNYTSKMKGKLEPPVNDVKMILNTVQAKVPEHYTISVRVGGKDQFFLNIIQKPKNYINGHS